MITKSNHVFELTYFSSPRYCAVSGEFLWGIMKEQGYECNKCGMVVNGKYISKIIGTCQAVQNGEIYQPTSGGVTSMVNVNIPHELATNRNGVPTPKTNYSFSIKVCCHSGKQILPFGKFYKCIRCKKVFKTFNNLRNNCGIDELKAYAAIKDIQARKDSAAQNVEVQQNLECVYQPVGGQKIQLKLGAKDQLEANLAKLANASDAITSKMNLDSDTKNKIKEMKKKSIKRVKDSKFNDFKIEKCLGQGSFGKVLLARYRSSKNDANYLALKAIRKDVTLENYDTEAVHLERDCLKLIDSRTGKSHPFLAHAICTFHDPGYLYFAMELISGGNLMDFVCGKGIVPLKQGALVALEVLLGLKFLHSQNIMYRDMKLDNVMSERG